MTVELFLATLLGLAALFVMFSKRRSRRDFDLLNQIPGPPTWPIVGNILEFLIPNEEILPKLLNLTNIYGPVIRFFTLGQVDVVLTDPENIEVIINNTNNISKSYAYDFLHPWLGLGLLTSTGNRWQCRRKLLSPFFHFQRLQQFLPVFNANSALLVERLRTQADAAPIDITSYVSLCTLDIICETAMDISVKAQDGQGLEYINAVKRMGELFHHRFASVWLHNDFVFSLSPSGREQKRVLEILHSFTENVIKERRKRYQASRAHHTTNRDPHKNSKMSLLDTLIDISERERSLSDRDIREEVDTFMFEGHDTTAVTISWTLFLLGCHRKIQEKVHDEMVSVFGCERRQPTIADLSNMPYLTKVIKESLRLYPSVPIISRTLDTEVETGKYTLPAGTNVSIIPFILHRNPDVFHQPEEFNPDRFSTEQFIGHHPFSYLPFSGGPRNCIGQKFAILEEKVILSSVIRNFEIQSLRRREDIKLNLEMMLKPTQPILLKLKPRILK